MHLNSSTLGAYFAHDLLLSPPARTCIPWRKYAYACVKEAFNTIICTLPKTILPYNWFYLYWGLYYTIIYVGLPQFSKQYEDSSNTTNKRGKVLYRKNTCYHIYPKQGIESIILFQVLCRLAFVNFKQVLHFYTSHAKLAWRSNLPVNELWSQKHLKLSSTRVKPCQHWPIV